MGDTGYRNFENDAASDFVSELIAHLLLKIGKIADSKYGMDPDEATCREMVAAIDLVHMIAKHTGQCLPESNRIQMWHDMLFNAWDQFFEHSPEYRHSKRIAVVRKTFEKAIAYCKQFDRLDDNRSSS